MTRCTIGFNVPGTNRNLAGFTRQVAFIEVLRPGDGFPRIEEEIRNLRVHFHASDTIGIDSVDLYMTTKAWCELRDVFNQALLDPGPGPV